MQEPVYVLHLITCHGRIMPRLAELLLKPLFRGNFDPFVNNANLGAIAHMSNDT